MAHSSFLELARGIDPSILLLATQFFIAAIVALWAKKLLDMIVGSIIFRMNRYVSIGSEVEVDSQIRGVVTSITWTSIRVTNDEEFMVIPTSKWMWRTWKFKNRS